MKIKLFILFSVIFVSSLYSQTTQKREFRGVWIHAVGDTQYKNMSTYELQRYFINLLNELQAMNFNAVIFQVRPAADALYPSKLEPWSRYLTGKQGVAPNPYFDPMYFMIEECHKRNMEFHAWINPYRVALNDKDILDKSHIYHKHPDRFIKYDSKILFDPGIPQNRDFICKVVKDIVKRYDIDAIHIDDYFYPYPNGQKFPDDISFKKYAKRQGFSANQLHDWRRNNVNLLIEKMNKTIKKEKSWVRFGVSPFGIYRNKRNTPDGSGSDTKGLEGYSELYADVKLWVKKGWIDYNIPQVYWKIGHESADYETLVRWWSRNNYGAHLYIGQDTKRTMEAPDLYYYSSDNQLTRKMELARQTPAIYGNCFFHAYDLTKNLSGIADSLKNNFHRYPALIPAYLHLHDKSPKEVKSLKAEWTQSGYLLKWQRDGNISNPKTAQSFIIYRFKEDELPNLEDVSKIVKITRGTEYLMPFNDGTRTYKYVVTSVDRFHNESRKGEMQIVKL